MTNFPYVAPAEDGLRRALADARGRRYRKAGLSTSTVAAVLAVAAAIAGGQGTQSLVQQPAPEQPAVTRLVPHEEVGDRNGAARPNQVGEVASFGSTSGAPVTAEAGGRQLHAPGSLSGEAPQHATKAVRKPYAAGAIRRGTGTPYLPSSCNVTGRTQDATALCPSVSVSSYSTGTYQLYSDVGSTRTGGASLHFVGHNEVDYAVYKGSKEVWRWSRWHSDGGVPHTVIIAPGNYCTWTFDWTGVDFTGKRLPSGNYTFRVEFLAEELANRSTMSYDFPVS